MTEAAQIRKKIKKKAAEIKRLRARLKIKIGPKLGFKERQKELARLFLDGTSLDELVRARKRSKGHLANEICLGALSLSERDPRALNLWTLFAQPSIGGIKALKKYNEKFR
jgi:hypothetical protein